MNEMDSQRNIKEYERWLDIIESQLKVFNHESCQKIFIYLRIFGKKTAVSLMDELNYSRGAIHTALNLLQDAHYIRKEEDPNVKDKRKNVFYYAIDREFSIIDDKDFLNYSIENKKLDIYLKWLKNSVKQSTSIIDFTYQIAIGSKLEKLQRKESESLNTILDFESVGNKSIITYSELGSISDQEKVRTKVFHFLQELEKEFAVSEYSKEPIPNPTLFSLFYIPVV